MRIPIAAALALILVFGCSDQPTTPTALNDGAVAPTLNYSNGPPVTGNGFRWTDDSHYFFWTLDTERWLWVEVSNDPAGGICVAGQVPGEVAYDIKFDNDWNWHVQSDDWYARVWDATGLTVETFCDWIDANAPIATGLVRFHEVAAGNKDDFMGTGQINRADGQGKTNLRTVFSWLWPKKTGDIVGVKTHTVHLGPDPRK